MQYGSFPFLLASGCELFIEDEASGKSIIQMVAEFGYNFGAMSAEQASLKKSLVDYVVMGQVVTNRLQPVLPTELRVLILHYRGLRTVIIQKERRAYDRPNTGEIVCVLILTLNLANFCAMEEREDLNLFPQRLSRYPTDANNPHTTFLALDVHPILSDIGRGSTHNKYPRISDRRVHRLDSNRCCRLCIGNDRCCIDCKTMNI